MRHKQRVVSKRSFASFRMTESVTLNAVKDLTLTSHSSLSVLLNDAALGFYKLSGGAAGTFFEYIAEVLVFAEACQL